MLFLQQLFPFLTLLSSVSNSKYLLQLREEIQELGENFNLLKPSTDYPTPVIDLKNLGKVQGLVQTLPNGAKVNFFQDIRYGRAKRFGLPVPEKPWKSVYHADHPRSICYQFYPPKLDMLSEDCLFLNIWQPFSGNKTNKSSPSSLKPVMVFIYGGGFVYGLTDIFLYNGAYLSTIGDVIMVSMNYRLGSFGFLYTGTDDAPGNQGVHDQILAIKWVKQNIDRFGGDPNRITVFGESAGSFSISAMILSPLAKGLFQRAILQSGAVSNIRELSPEYALEKTKAFAQRLNCSNASMKKLVYCLRRKSATDLLIASDPLHFLQILTGQGFTIIYGDRAGLLPDKPGTLLKNGKQNPVDMIYGFNHDEYGFVMSYLYPEITFLYWVFYRPMVVEKMKEFGKTFQLQDVDKVVDFYTKDMGLLPGIQTVREAMINFGSDPSLICSTYLFGKQMALAQRKNQSNQNHIYGYRFDQSLFCKEFMGGLSVWHAFDLPYTFGIPLHGIASHMFKAEDRRISRDMIKTWTRFARYGQLKTFGSKIKWPEAIMGKNDTTIRLMSIKPTYQVIRNEYIERCEKFWDKYLYQTV